MRARTSIYIIVNLFVFSTTASYDASSSDIAKCIDKPSVNATADNYPGAPARHNIDYPYDVSSLAGVPVAASACKSDDPDVALACARAYIDAIDEQISFLYARRLGYAAVAAAAKFNQGLSLNDPTRNQAIAARLAARVTKYGGSEETGWVMGGEGCQIYASVEYEAQRIRTCGGDLNETFERNCN